MFHNINEISVKVIKLSTTKLILNSEFQIVLNCEIVGFKNIN